MTPEERETIVTTSDGDDVVRIWTAQRPVISRLQKDTRFTLIDSGFFEGSKWAEFTIPRNQWNPVSGAKKRYKVSEERRAQLAEQMARARAAKT